MPSDSLRKVRIVGLVRDLSKRKPTCPASTSVMALHWVKRPGQRIFQNHEGINSNRLSSATRLLQSLITARFFDWPLRLAENYTRCSRRYRLRLTGIHCESGFSRCCNLRGNFDDPSPSSCQNVQFALDEWNRQSSVSNPMAPLQFFLSCTVTSQNLGANPYMGTQWLKTIFPVFKTCQEISSSLFSEYCPVRSQISIDYYNIIYFQLLR